MTSVLRTTIVPPLRREGPIHAFTVCINYSDYLAVTLPINRKYFKCYYLVTEASDKATIELARKHDCTLILSELKKADGAVFNLSGMVFEAQKLIHSSHPYDWICKLDADVAINEKIMSLNTAALDARAIYGATREIFEKKTDIDLSRGIIGTHAPDYILGFFQLYWDKTKYYPKWSNNCSKSDIDFMKQFTHYRFTFKNIICQHYGPTGANWDGRISEIWNT